MFGDHSSGSFKAVKLWATDAIEIVRPVLGLENATFVNTSESHNQLDATAEDETTPHNRKRGVSLRTPKPAPNNVTREAAVADRA